MKFQEFHDFRKITGSAARAPAPAPGHSWTDAETQVPERPPHGRAGGNPAPSRRESGPEPTELLPRPRPPSPLFLNLPYSLPVRAGAAHPPPRTQNSKTPHQFSPF